jgi:hypothetical protein
MWVEPVGRRRYRAGRGRTAGRFAKSPKAGIANHGIGQPPVEESGTAKYFAPVERRTRENSDGGILPGVLLYGHTTSKSRPTCGKTAAKSSRPV